MSAKYLGEPRRADTLSRAKTRVAESAFRRVSFVLNGVATPSELARDRTVTPFNIGESVSLSDFTIDEAESLLRDPICRPEQAANCSAGS